MLREYREVKINEVVRTVPSDTIGTYYVEYCNECGAPVYNKGIHENWHEKIEEIVHVLRSLNAGT